MRVTHLCAILRHVALLGCAAEDVIDEVLSFTQTGSPTPRDGRRPQSPYFFNMLALRRLAWARPRRTLRALLNFVEKLTFWKTGLYRGRDTF